jgi:hypothetical protein
LIANISQRRPSVSETDDADVSVGTSSALNHDREFRTVFPSLFSQIGDEIFVAQKILGQRQSGRSFFSKYRGRSERCCLAEFSARRE